ncbi:uncharacterized protein LOC144922755 isoform X2 [Branchiostoma floridae x Branchiostoma belcheri]
MAAARSLDNTYSNEEDESAVLLVHTEYGKDKVGSSFLHRQVVETIREREPDIPVFSTVLHATEKDKQDAQEDGVELILPKLEPGDKRTDPTPDWLTFDHRSKYPDLPTKVRSIVGHADVTSRAAINIKDGRCPEAKVVLIYNDTSEDTQGNEKVATVNNSALQNAQEADVVFSVGNKVFDHFENQFRATDKQPKHFEFLPRPSKRFEHTKASYKDTKTMTVLSIGRVKSVHNLKGHDLVTKALDTAAGKRNMECHIRGINEEDFQASDKDILQTHFKTTHLKRTLHPYGTLTDLHNDMLKAHLGLIPSEEEPFELAGLDAIAAGIPVLVSDKSGLADFMTKISPEFCYSVVNIEGNEEDKVKQWAKRIEQSLSNCETEFERAARCRDKLLSAKYWEESHQQLICSCIQTGGPSREADEDTVTERTDQSGTEEMGLTEAPAQGASTILYQAAIPQLVGGPPLLPVVVDIIAQVLPSVKTPGDMLVLASALETLSTVTESGDETLSNSLLKQIKSRTKNIKDLKKVMKALKKLERFKGIKVIYVEEGSLIFYLQCTDMSGLGDLWFMYRNGELDNLLHSSLVSEETLQQLHAESISVKSTINIEDFRKALVYLITTCSAKGEPTSRLPQEYPLYEPRTHTTTSVLDVLHLDGTSLTRSPGKQQELHIPSTAQTGDSEDHLGTKLGDQPVAGATASPVIADQHRSTGVQVEQMTSELALHTSVRPKDIQRLRAGSKLSTASIGSAESLLSMRTTHSTGTSQSADTGYATASILSEEDRIRTSSKSAFKIRDDEDPQVNLNLLLAELNTLAVKRNKLQQFELYCQIGDLYRTKLHDLKPALQYYKNMLECSQELSEDTKQAKAYNRLGIIYGRLGKQQKAFRNHERALLIDKFNFKLKRHSDICEAYKKQASSLALSGQGSDAKANYEFALAVAMEAENKTEQMDIYCKLGDLHREQLHEPQESHKYYTEMLALARDMGRKDRERLAYNKLGLACGDMQDYEAALEWDKKYLKMCQESGDKVGQTTAHENVAGSYKALGKLHLARSHYQSAMTIAKETGNKTEQMDIYFELGDLHREQLHEPQESHKYYTEMLALARDLGRKDREGAAYNGLGVACWNMQDYEAALEWCQKDLKVSHECGDKTAQITANKNIADTYKSQSKLNLAGSHYQSALTIAIEAGNKTEQMDIYLELGDLHREQLHEPQESHKYYTEMLALARDLGRKDREGAAYNKLGGACWNMQDYEAALEWCQKDLKVSQEIGDKTGQLTAHNNIADSYKVLDKLDLARSHYQSAMTIAMETGNKTRQMDIYWKLGDLHREQLHEPQESHKYYTEMLALARDLGRKDRERLAYNRLRQACGDMQDYEAALEWDKKYLKMSQESGDKTAQITAHQNTAGSYKTLGKLGLARSHYQSAMTIAMETGNKNQQMDIYFELGDLHREQLHEPQEAHKYYTEMLALARDLGRKDDETLAYNRLGHACGNMQDYETALEWDKKYLKMSKESGDKTVQISANNNIADSYKALGKLDLARSHYQSAMTIAMETGNKTEQMKIYLKLGDLHREQLHKPQESHKYYTEMLALARDLGRKDRERLAYNRLGLTCEDMQDYEAALEWNKKYLKMSQESGDKTVQITAHKNIAATYKALGKLDLARSHYQLAMTIAMETENKTRQMDIYLELGDLHWEQLHEPQESHKYYTEMLALARDLGRKDKERQAYNRLGLACGDMQDYEAALEWNKKYLKMSQESGDKTGQITAHKSMAEFYKALGKLDLVRSHYQSAITIAMETGNKQTQEVIAKKLANL